MALYYFIFKIRFKLLFYFELFWGKCFHFAVFLGILAHYFDVFALVILNSILKFGLEILIWEVLY